jgi:dTDP-L-rhamnose 4-epimerase
MRQGLPINIFEDGRESRDFVHVSDVVRAICLSLESPLERFAAINIGSGHQTTVYEVASLLRQLLGSESPLQVTGDFRVGDIRHCYADLTKARTLLDFEPAVDITMGMEWFVNWALGQEIVEDFSAHAQRQLTELGLGRES